MGRGRRRRRRRREEEGGGGGGAGGRRKGRRGRESEIYCKIKQIYGVKMAIFVAKVETK